MTPEEWREDYLAESRSRGFLGRYLPWWLGGLAVYAAGTALGTPFIARVIGALLFGFFVDVLVWWWNRRSGSTGA